MKESCSIVSVFNIYTKKSMDIEIDKSNKDKPSFIRWAKNYPTLAIGTEKGFIYYYSKKTDKIVPCSLNHSKKIISGDWNDEGNLATGGEDKMIAVTNRVGDPILQGASLKYEPKVLRWARQKTIETRNNYTTLSTIMNNKTILIYDIKKKNNPIELALDTEYGSIFF